MLHNQELELAFSIIYLWVIHMASISKFGSLYWTLKFMYFAIYTISLYEFWLIIINSV